MLLAIDVGNTRTKAAISGSGASFEVRSEVTSTKILGLIEEISSQKPEFAAVASVQPLFNDIVAEILERYSVPFQFLNAENAGIPNHYETPETLGADRIANAVYLSEEGSWPAVSVDFGTATKIDVVGFSENELSFLGGAILPGVQMGVRSLSRDTAQLPEFGISIPERVVGRSTKECLQSGTVLGHAKAVEGLISAIREELGLDEPMDDGQVYELPAVATGGLASLMAPLCPSISRVEPYLTLEGLLIAARRWAAAR